MSMTKAERSEMDILKMRLQEVARERDELRQAATPASRIIVNPYGDAQSGVMPHAGRMYQIEQNDIVQYRFDNPINRRWINVTLKKGHIEIMASDSLIIRSAASNMITVETEHR